MEKATNDNIAVEILTDMLANNLVECEEVARRSVNGKTFIDVVINNVDKDSTFKRFLEGTEATLNRKRYTVIRIDPADIIEIDLNTVNLENKSVSIILLKFKNTDRKELKLGISDRDEVEKLVQYLFWPEESRG